MENIYYPYINTKSEFLLQSISVEQESQKLKKFLLNFNADVFSEKNGEHAPAVLTGRQFFMITKY